MVVKFKILNLTPDSFSDGDEQILDVKNSLAKAQDLIEDATTVLDIGAESTRPGANVVAIEEEWSRLKPFLEAYELEAKLSIDTYKPEIVSRIACDAKLAAKVNYINDVKALTESGMAKACSVLNQVRLEQNLAPLTLVIMHSKGGVPPKIKAASVPDCFYTEDSGLFEHMYSFFEKQIEHAKNYCLKDEQIILDPGLGFGKNLKQSLVIIDLIPKLKQEFGLEVFVGASRKGFLKLWAKELGLEVDLDQLTERYHKLAVGAGASYLRTHI